MKLGTTEPAGSFAVALVWYSVAALADYWYTRQLFDLPGSRELGPLVRRAGPHAVTVLSAVAAVALSVGWYHCKYAWTLPTLLALAVAHTIAWMWNLRQVDKRDRP